MVEQERKRIQSKEVCSRPFDSTIHRDNYRTERYANNSLQAGQSLDGQVKHMELFDDALSPTRASYRSILRKSNSKQSEEQMTFNIKVQDQVKPFKDSPKSKLESNMNVNDKLITNSIQRHHETGGLEVQPSFSKLDVGNSQPKIVTMSLDPTNSEKRKEEIEIKANDTARGDAVNLLQLRTVDLSKSKMKTQVIEGETSIFNH